MKAAPEMQIGYVSERIAVVFASREAACVRIAVGEERSLCELATS